MTTQTLIKKLNREIATLRRDVSQIKRVVFASFKNIKEEVLLTSRQKQSIAKSERELKRGEYLTLNELHNYVGSSRTKTRR